MADLSNLKLPKLFSIVKSNVDVETLKGKTDHKIYFHESTGTLVFNGVQYGTASENITKLQNAVLTIARELGATSASLDSLSTASDISNSRLDVIESSYITDINVGGSAYITGQKSGNSYTISLNVGEIGKTDGLAYVADVKTYMGSYMASTIESLDANINSTGGSYVTINVVEADGKLTGVTVTENDIASATVLASEVTRATGKEAELATAISEEENRATTKETELATAISAEETRATGAEEDLEKAISDEETRATGVEGTLSNLTTTAQGNLVAAINEVNATAKASRTTVTTSYGLTVTGTKADDDSYTYNIATHVQFTTENNQVKLVDTTTKDVVAYFNISDVVAGGMLSYSYYSKETGKLTLGFNNGTETLSYVDVNLSEMLDINDVVVDKDSSNYLSVDLDGGENSQAVFSVLTKALADATDTNNGLATAYDVKSYVGSYVSAIYTSLYTYTSDTIDNLIDGYNGTINDVNTYVTYVGGKVDTLESELHGLSYSVASGTPATLEVSHDGNAYTVKALTGDVTSSAATLTTGAQVYSYVGTALTTLSYEGTAQDTNKYVTVGLTQTNGKVTGQTVSVSTKELTSAISYSATDGFTVSDATTCSGLAVASDVDAKLKATNDIVADGFNTINAWEWWEDYTA